MIQLIENHNLRLEASAHAVMLIHGMGGNTVEVERMAKGLHSSGFSVFAANIQGFCHGMPASNWETWMAQAIEHFHYLKKHYSTVSIVGVSMGATLALAVAEQEDVDVLVLLGTALAYDGWAMPWYNFLIKILPIVPFKNRYIYRETEPYGVKNKEMQRVIKKVLETGQVSEIGGESISLRHLAQGIKLIAHVREHIAKVNSPTLVMHAVEDETVSIKNAEWIFNHISAKNKDIIHLGDCYHMITIDNERETVLHETERFIKRSLNAAQPHPVFELSPLLSRELRRLLKNS